MSSLGAPHVQGVLPLREDGLPLSAEEVRQVVTPLPLRFALLVRLRWFLVPHARAPEGWPPAVSLTVLMSPCDGFVPGNREEEAGRALALPSSPGTAGQCSTPRPFLPEG